MRSIRPKAYHLFPLSVHAVFRADCGQLGNNAEKQPRILPLRVAQGQEDSALSSALCAEICADLRNRCVYLACVAHSAKYGICSLRVLKAPNRRCHILNAASCVQTESADGDPSTPLRAGSAPQPFHHPSDEDLSLGTPGREAGATPSLARTLTFACGFEGPESPCSFRCQETHSNGCGTLTEAMPAAVAASMPSWVSSNTTHSDGGTPRRSAASRKASGAGFPRA